ncbi:MAG TPA: PRC-barrel domain-containing protein [Usitatibacter sp.]|jgi:hypothetical protein|nr:PRC-barrel domain-containing protein [Usitatibacter sp.]
MGRLHPGRDPLPPSSAGGGARIENAQPIASSPGPGPFVMSCAGLGGDRIVNRRGEELGQLEHVMIDVPSGRVAYAVLARGGVFGLGAKLFAIPWEALTLDAPRQCFVLDVERERLDRAPGFDRDHWPAMADEAWATGVHDYYGRAPYWKRACAS